jgi:uncharacterized protein YjbI with pentapeptide repeats
VVLALPTTKESADVEDNFRKTVGQLIGGAAVLIGAGFAFFQFLQQQKTTQEQQQTTRTQQEIAQSQLLLQQQAALQQQQAAISNQVSKGFEQLASEKLALRLGGIYALEGAMNTSEQYRVPALEALCAFVRENTVGKTASEKPATDVQAALTVIGRRIKGPGVVDLANVSIPEANLIDANLRRANLIGADLRRADLSGTDLRTANLRGTNLSGAKLGYANLSGADLSYANLSYANLLNANLNGAYLSVVNLRDAILNGANLTRAYLTRANLSNAHLLNANLNGANLSGANLRDRGADLGGARVLTQTQLDAACGDADTKLPEGLKPPKPCQAIPVPPRRIP